VKFENSDIKLVKRWKAHKDAINWITWVPELEVTGSCSYDCNVYLWNRECGKVGSLVLGNKATAPDQVPDPETARYRKDWDITINKITRYEDELSEAKEIWDQIRDPKAPSY
jgi:WD40 repeat protein